MAILSKDAISHPTHPEHKLKLMATGNDSFQCNGCKEPGAGERYTCQSCNFDLHKDCALAEATLVHPLHKNRKFKLCHEPPRPSDDSRMCDACCEKVLGFHYHSNGMDLHPCCAKLPLVIHQEGLTLELRKEASYYCKNSWVYRSTCKTVYLHPACVKEIARRPDDNRLIHSVKKAAIQNYRGQKAGRKFKRICKMVAAAVRIIVGVIIGDPTAIIAAVVAALISNTNG